MSDLVQIVDAAVADAYHRGGAHLVCHPGCTQCCIGVFAISHQDAARLREGLSALEQSDPDRAARIRLRATASVARLAPHLPGNPATGILNPDAEDYDDFDEFANDEPCPVLDPATGTCDLYRHRPILCRAFGPPTRTPEGHLATSELCFTHATTAEIASAELDPTLHDLEQSSNEAFNAAHHLDGEILLAWALLPNPVER